MEKTEIKEVYYDIHRALHNSKVTSIWIDGLKYPVKAFTGGIRCIEYDGIRFTQQNPDKRGSKYAERARRGEKITWGMRPGKWLLITD